MSGVTDMPLHHKRPAFALFRACLLRQQGPTCKKTTKQVNDGNDGAIRLKTRSIYVENLFKIQVFFRNFQPAVGFLFQLYFLLSYGTRQNCRRAGSLKIKKRKKLQQGPYKPKRRFFQLPY
jgi:hypothetical protein